jgi:hypothetical protein
MPRRAACAAETGARRIVCTALVSKGLHGCSSCTKGVHSLCSADRQSMLFARVLRVSVIATRRSFVLDRAAPPGSAPNPVLLWWGAGSSEAEREVRGARGRGKGREVRGARGRGKGREARGARGRQGGGDGRGRSSWTRGARLPRPGRGGREVRGARTTRGRGKEKSGKPRASVQPHRGRPGRRWRRLWRPAWRRAHPWTKCRWAPARSALPPMRLHDVARTWRSCKGWQPCSAGPCSAGPYSPWQQHRQREEQPCQGCCPAPCQPSTGLPPSMTW